MKSLFLATAAVAAFAAAPAFAQDATGSIGLVYNNVKYDAGVADYTAENGKVDVAVAVPVTGDWTVTLDGGFSYSNNAIAGEDNSNVDGTIHASTLVNGIRVGGFAGGSQAGTDTLWAFGAQGQVYLDKMTLSGSVAYETANDSDVDAWSVAADAAYFITPAFRVNGGLAWNTLDLGGTDVDAWSANVGGEYQIAETPISIVANYGYGELEDVDLTVNTLTVGFRYSFGGDLQARSRAGADVGRTAATVSSLAGVF